MTLQQQLDQLTSRSWYRFPPEGVPADFRSAAVLILLWEEGGTTHTLLTRRAEHLRTFAGQMCFPGGRLDEGESFERAALRETHEEVGIAPELVQVVGRLDDAWSGGRYLMAPYVGYLSSPPVTVANEKVARIVHLPLDESLEAEHVEVTANGVTYKEQRIRADSEWVTGLTADLLMETIEFLGNHNQQRGKTRYHYLLEYEAARLRPDPESS